MDKDIEHAEKALACIDKMKEGLSELVSLLDIADDTFGEMDRLETYKSINRTLGRWQEKYEGFLTKPMTWKDGPHIMSSSMRSQKTPS